MSTFKHQQQPLEVRQLALVAVLGILVLFFHPLHSEAQQKKSQGKPPQKVRISKNINIYPDSPYRGWDFIVEKLKADGVSAAQIAAVYQNKKFPWFTEIPFAVKPRENPYLYRNFMNKSRLNDARQFILENREIFDEVEKTLKVTRYAVTALLMMETHFGKNTGRDIVIYRLSRLASANDPKNLQRNFERLRKTERDLTFEQVATRGQYLEERFYPEVKALMQIGIERDLDLLTFHGSSAGAFGMPQFLPTSMLKFGYDGNRDGKIDLFDRTDAIWSTANYLANFGWDDGGDDEIKRQAFWSYNHSEPYVSTAMNVKQALRNMFE